MLSFLLALLLSAPAHPVQLQQTARFDGAGSFLDLEGADVLPDGTWLVADKLSYQIVRLGPAGDVKARAGGRGRGPGQFAGPGPLSAAKGLLAVADFGTPRIQLFSSALTFRRAIRAPGPVFDLHFDGRGMLWVAGHGEQVAGILAAFDTSGRERLRIHPRGTTADIFSDVFQFSLLPGGMLCLAYMTQNSIEVWTGDGRFVRAFRIPGLPERSHTRPLAGPAGTLAVPVGNIFRSMTADRAGRIYLLGDEYSEHPLQDVYICDSAGRLLATALLPVRATLIRSGPDGSLYAVTGQRDTVRKFTVHLRGS